MQIILGTHVEWRDLVCGKSDKGELSIGAASVPYAASPITGEEAGQIIASAAPYAEPAAIDPKGELHNEKTFIHECVFDIK